ncbi:MAG TPA: hypothetical protein DIC18_01445 [Clostridiales bacterium]|nr:hypothetical protein [Clostridiales bacterium]
MDTKLVNSLYKKAVGYTVTEKTTEYSPEGEVIKRKVTSKHYPPDIVALKAYLELISSGEDYEKLSDEELESEKERLLKELEGMKSGSDQTERESEV